MQKILITGASGFIGSFLVEKALSAGLETHAGIRASSSKKWLQDERIHFRLLDFERPELIATLLKKENYDYIIHCAGITKAATKEQYYKVNFQYVKILANAISTQKNSLKKFIFISSLAAFGPGDFQPNGKISRQCHPSPITAYGKSKLAAERFLKTLPNIPWLIIRPTIVYGPRERELLRIFKLINLHLEILAGPTDQLLSFIYVKDLVELIFKALWSDKFQTAYFASDGAAYRTSVFYQYIKNELNRKTLSLRLNIYFLRLLTFFSECLGHLSGQYSILNKEKLKEMTVQSWDCDTSFMQEELDFRPTYTLKEGLEETVDWYKAHQWI